MALEPLHQLLDIDPLIELVDGLDIDIDIRPEHATVNAIERNAEHRGE